jgi:antitoxin (DNA-binding transcriptional repressor) of toxin-antitoxin stability system
MNKMSLSGFKAHCIKEIKRVNRTNEPLTVTLKGEPIARIEPIHAETPVKLGSHLGQARIRRDLVEIDLSHEWEVNY